MLYYVQPRDSLYIIAKRFNTTVQDIMEANVICNPNFIFVGQPLIIPEPEIELIYKAGGWPYYIVLPGDTLWCLSKQFNTSIEVLAKANKIQNPNFILPNTELLIAPNIPNPDELHESWKSRGNMYCDMMSSLMEHGIYYIGSFMWESLGEKAIPYLLDLYKHPCNTVRFYTVISLGRLASNQEIEQVLIHALRNDPDPYVAEIAGLALRRINFAQKFGKRIHVTTNSNFLLEQPNLSSSEITRIPQGTEIIALRWQIPSPTGEERPRGDLQLYDQIMIVQTGQIGFIPRVGFNAITLI